MTQRVVLAHSLALIFQGISQLSVAFSGRKFAMDGRLVGDIGESLAGLDYDLLLDEKSLAFHDATLPDGRRVQIKATFQNHLTFKNVPELYLGFKINRDGTYQEIFNGPGEVIFDRFKERKYIGEKLLRFPIKELATLGLNVPEQSRVPRRELSVVSV